MPPPAPVTMIVFPLNAVMDTFSGIDLYQYYAIFRRYVNALPL
ncbi:protein of unknown function [Rhodovastum atsumiense]|nr:protein of unknown function [Rhodovastum atsumiense]